MAKSPLPLLLLAGGAFLMAKKGGSAKGGADTTNGTGQETASPDKDTPVTDQGGALMILGPNCQPVQKLVDNDEDFKKQVRDYISKRATEIYQVYQAGSGVTARLNTGPLSDSQWASLEADGEVASVNRAEEYITVYIDQVGEIYHVVYSELVPPSCSPKLILGSAMQDPIYPSAAAACMAAVIQLAVDDVLWSAGVNDLIFPGTDKVIQACSGMDLGIQVGEDRLGV